MISLQPGDVIYARGWAYCYTVISAPFCGIHYCRWRGHLAAAPQAARNQVTYLVRPLGSQRVDRLSVRV